LQPYGHDPSATEGVPAHITINYPFLPGLDFSEILRLDLKGFFNGFPSFEFSYQRLGRFPDILYLPPEPSESFTQLIQSVVEPSSI
jgi:hypothetical protein